jgi:hypothetical protein
MNPRLSILLVLLALIGVMPLKAKESTDDEPNAIYKSLRDGCDCPPLFLKEKDALKILRDQGFEDAQAAFGRGKQDDYLFVVLRAFRGTPHDLSVFFDWSSKETGSASGSESNDLFTVGLLCHWGDHQFSRVLAKQTQKIRKRILSNLWVWDFPGQKRDFAHCFPETATVCGLKATP